MNGIDIEKWRIAPAQGFIVLQGAVMILIPAPPRDAGRTPLHGEEEWATLAVLTSPWDYRETINFSITIVR